MILSIEISDNMVQGAKDRRHNQSYRQALSSINEIIANSEFKMELPKLIDADEFEKANEVEQMGSIVSTLNLMIMKISEIDNSLVHPETGIDTRLDTCQNQADGNSEKITELKWENGILKGLLQRQSKQIQTLNTRVTQLTAKSMEKNLLISGIPEPEGKEDCRATMLTFFKETLEIDASEEEILVAHRRGPEGTGSRQMLARCTIPLRERALANSKVLKDKVNSSGGKYYVNKQLPDVMVEENKELRQTIREQKERDAGLPAKDRSKITVKQKKVYIDGAAVEKQLLPPQPIELFVDKLEREKMEKIKFSLSDTSSLEGSEFIAFAFKTGQLSEVKRAYRKVKTLHPSADHIVAAFNLKSVSGFQDDGELGGGYKMLQLLKENRPMNSVVFVVRHKNGGNIGVTRYELMEQVATQALTRLR